jgi:hypothetical protein
MLLSVPVAGREVKFKMECVASPEPFRYCVVVTPYEHVSPIPAEIAKLVDLHLLYNVLHGPNYNIERLNSTIQSILADRPPANCKPN